MRVRKSLRAVVNNSWSRRSANAIAASPATCSSGGSGKGARNKRWSQSLVGVVAINESIITASGHA